MPLIAAMPHVAMTPFRAVAGVVRDDGSWRRRSRPAVILAVGLMLLAPARGRGQPPDGLAAARALETAVVDVIAEGEKSVVSIARVDVGAFREPRDVADVFAMRDPRNELRGPESLDYLPEAFGSGVIVYAGKNPNERFVVTNYHVVRGNREWSIEQVRERTRLYVRLASKHVLQAEILAAEERCDLAVLKLDLKAAGIDPDDVPPIKLGEADNLRKGQFVVALGNPYAIGRDGSASASMGMISNISRRPAAAEADAGGLLGSGTIHHYGTLLHVDTRLNLGTSGGALLNLDGQLIGLTTSLAALQGYEKSVGYAIPFDAGLRRCLEDLLQGYEVEYGFLGVTPGDFVAGDMRSFRGLIDQPSAAGVLQVAQYSPAYEGGLRVGDVILKVNARTIYGTTDLMREVGLLGPGAVATLKVFRPTERRTLDADVRLAKWPVYDDAEIIATRRRHPPWRGLQVDYPTGRLRYLPDDRFSQYVRAVVVTHVEPDSAADKAGLQPGNFIAVAAGRRVTTPAEFHDAVGGTSGSIALSLQDGRTLTLPADPAGDRPGF